jgi:SWI/SNF-related matrix-associated actin-dependent regulator of chromatin subfamily A-like protein 1
MSDRTFSVPPGKSLTRGQPKSIQDVIHVLRHGAVEGTGTARGALLADEMGTGKTIVAIVAANTLEFRRILVICPAHLREMWVSEIRTWQTLGHLVIPVKATSQYEHAFLPSITSGWVVIKYDILSRHPEIKAHPWDLLICDESHLLKNFMARRTCEIFGGKYQGERIEPIPVEKALLLSGTPFLNRPDELYTQISYLDRTNWPTFKGFVEYEADASVDDERRVTGEPRNLNELQRKLRNTIMVRQLKCDVLDLPPKVYEEKWVDHTQPSDALPDWLWDMRRQIAITQRKLRKAKSRVERHELRERLNKLLEDVRYEVGVAKFNDVLVYLMQLTEKTLVFAYHHEIIEGLATALRRAGGDVVTVTGRTRDPTTVVQHFQERPDCLFFIGNIRAAVGITMTAACHVVFAELDWTPAVHHQAEDRAHRIGQSEQVKVVTFILDDDNATDRQIYRLLEAKEIASRQALNSALVTGTTKGAEPDVRRPPG